MPGRDEVMAMMHGYGYGGGLYLFMGLLSFLLLVGGVLLIAAVAVRAMRRGPGWGHGPGRHPQGPGAGWGTPGGGWGAPGGGAAGAAPAGGPSAAALGILEERLARGEIDIESYRTLRAELTRTDPAPPS